MIVPPRAGYAFFNCFYENTKALHQAIPEMVMIGSCYSELKADAPYIAAGALAENAVSMVGFGRMALSYAGFGNDLLNGRFDADQACRACGGCARLLIGGKPVTCVVRTSSAN